MIKTPISLIVCFLLTVNIFAQSADDKEVTARVEALRLAMISGDKASLENLTAEDLSYGHSSGKIEDKASFLGSVSGGSNFRSISLTEQTVKIVDNTAMVRHKLFGETGTIEKPEP